MLFLLLFFSEDRTFIFIFFVRYLKISFLYLYSLPLRHCTIDSVFAFAVGCSTVLLLINKYLKKKTKIQKKEDSIRADAGVISTVRWVVFFFFEFDRDLKMVERSILEIYDSIGNLENLFCIRGIQFDSYVNISQHWKLLFTSEHVALRPPLKSN